MSEIFNTMDQKPLWEIKENRYNSRIGEINPHLECKAVG